MAAVYGLSIATAALLATMAALGLSIICCGSKTAACGSLPRCCCWACSGGPSTVTFLRPGWTRLRDVDLALLVQRRFPSLGDRLLSAVEFLHVADDDPAAGSTALRQAMVAATTAETEPLDFSAVLDPRPTARAAAALARGVPSGRRLRRARSVGLADRRGPAGKPFRRGRLAADDPFGDSPAGGARRPGTGLPDRGGRCPRRPAAVGSSHPLPLRRARCRGGRGDRSPAIRGRGDDGPARERSAAVFLSRGRRRRPVDAVVRRASGRAAGHRVGLRAVDPAGLYRLAARAGQAEHPRPGGHPRRDRRRGHQAAQIGHPVLGRRSADSRPARRRRQATRRRLHGRKIRLLLVRSDRPRGPWRRQRRSLGDPRHSRHAADGEHRAADGESLRHAAGRGADSRGGQGQSGRPQHGPDVSPLRFGAGSHAAAVGVGRGGSP